jgi:hypothetical protein
MDYRFTLMNKSRFLFTAMMAVVFLLHLAGPSWSAPIGAKAVYVEGYVRAISAADAKMRSVAKGDAFVEGDRIITSASGALELELDTGDLIRVDKNSDMVIKALNRNPKGSTFSIFSLMIGRVKSAVSKLADSDSKFEYHTKAAICGVSGTPPFVVETTDGQTSVDLLGEPGEKGAVYVKGFDPAGTMVTVFSASRTVANFGAPPLAPFPISPERRQQLNKVIPFKTVPKTQKAPEPKKDNVAPKEEPKKDEPKKEEPKEKPADNKGQQGGAGGANEPAANPPPNAPDTSFRDSIDKMTINNLSGSVSVPKQVAPGEAAGGAGVGQTGGPEQGVIGDQTTTSGAVETPPAANAVRIRIRLK